MAIAHPRPSSPLVAGVAVCFVIFWGTGYIAARFTKELFLPFNLLFARYVLTAIFVFGIVLYRYRLDFAQRIRRELNIIQIVMGALYHVAYIGCVFYAVRLGLSAGIAAVILATQPLVTTLTENMLSRTRPKTRVWSGAAICIVGSALVAGETAFTDLSFDPLSLLIAAVGVLSISVATVMHGRAVHSFDLWPALFVQFTIAALAIAALLAAGIEPFEIRIDLYSLAVVLFLVIVTTLGSYAAMNWLIRNMTTSTYSLLFYLVPPAVFAMEYLIFGTTVSIDNIVGCSAVLVGVYISLNGFSLPKRTRELDGV